MSDKQQIPTKIYQATTRRGFLKRAAGFSFIIGTGGLISACAPEGEEPSNTELAISNSQPLEPNIWVTINPDDSIVVKYAGTEMGQGSMTHVPMMLAEFLDAQWDNVKVEIVEIHDTKYGNPIFQNMLYTAGSTHVMIYGKKMRVAGAQARKLLMMAVSNHWGVALSELSTQPSLVSHVSSGRSISYGDIVASMAMPENMPEVLESEYKQPVNFRYIGKQVMRRDVPDKVRGTAAYGMDVQVPGMSYAAILRSPVENDGPLEIDDSLAKKVKGVTDIVALPYGVAVIGDTVESTKIGKSKLIVKWTETSSFRNKSTDSSLKEYSTAAEDLTITGVTWNEKGDAKKVLGDAENTIEALYTSDPAYHAQMEPLNATASVTNDGKSAEIWVGTQSQSMTIIGAAEALETDEANITLHSLTMGGGFGRRSRLRQLYVDDALFVSKALKRPIKVIWSREDDLEAGHFRTAAAMYMRGAFDDSGKLIAMHQRVAAPNILPTMNKHRWAVVKPKDVITMAGSENRTYDIENFLAEHIEQERCSRVIAFRGVGTGYTKFAQECFIDELAEHKKMDPLAFRLSISGNNARLIKVINTVAEMAEWDRPRKDGVGLGIALSGYHNSLSAGIVELSVNAVSGMIKVHKFWAVGDPGLVISPRNAEAQVNGNIVFGLSNALKERIVIKNGIVQETNFHQYPILRMNEMPEIESRVLSTDNPSSGVGELGTAMVAPAIANAIASLTGKRIRHQPFTPALVAAALRV